MSYMPVRPVLAGVILILAACLLADARGATSPASQGPGARPEPFAQIAKHGHLAFASGIITGDQPAPPDITVQTMRVLDELGRRLAQEHTSLDRVAAATVYLTNAEDFAAMNAVWAKYFPVDPPTRTTVVTPLPSPGARIQVSAIAGTGGSSRQVVLPKGWRKSPSPYNYGIRVDDTLFLSGLVSRRGEDNTAVAGDISTQTRTVFANAQAILTEAGFTLADVVSARVFITDVANFEAMNAVYRSYFPDAPPARATVKTALTSPDYLIEITFLAARGFPRTVVVTPNADGTPGKPNANLSPAIAVGPRLFLSGMLGIVPGAAADVAAQTTEALARLGRTLSAGGFTWQDAFDFTVYVTDVASPDAVLRALREKSGRRAAGTLVGSELVSADGRVEIMLTAGK